MLLMKLNGNILMKWKVLISIATVPRAFTGPVSARSCACDHPLLFLEHPKR